MNRTQQALGLNQSIKTELRRLNLHPVNLDSVTESDGSVLLKGSLLGSWQVPKSIDGQWFLKVLKGLPDLAGPKATMDAYYEAYMAVMQNILSRRKDTEGEATSDLQTAADPKFATEMTEANAAETGNGAEVIK